MRVFRTDIEGLRALAVVLVILFHYQVPGITGGFIGVDVFFVISGYVITQTLERSLSLGNFRFRDFYARRIRRLVPLFLLVSTTTFLLISPYYFDEDYYVFAKSWLSSLVGLSNFYYFAELRQYFSPEAHSMPLLHTWSLAVEEQFYLFWPAALFLSWRVIRQRSAVLLFLLLWAALFGLSVYLADSHPKAAYYLLPARLFELMLGGGLALFAQYLPTLQRAGAELLSAMGLLLIIGTALLISGADHFPGYNALWPTLGTGLVLYAGMHHSRTLVARLLSLRVMVFIGAISYSLYLWHWPPVALMHYQLVELTWLNRLAMVGLVTLLSWLSYRYVENRYRYRPWRFRQSLMLLIILPLLAIWAIQTTIRLADDTSFRIPAERRDLYRIISQDAGDAYKPCFKGDEIHFDQSSACRLGAADAAPDGVLIGDSHATALAGFVEQLLMGSGTSMLLVTQASTPFVSVDRADQAFAHDAEKRDRSRALSAYLDQRPMTVMLGAWWRSYLENPAFEEYFLDTLEWLLQRQHRVIVIEGVPELPSAAYAHCLLKDMENCSLDADAVQRQLGNFYKFKEIARKRFPQVEWINPREAICDEQRCETVLNGIPLYRDESHLNLTGSREIGRVYLQRGGLFHIGGAER
ncbi:MAG: acyltransferase family protein [Pseudomonas sp.]